MRLPRISLGGALESLKQYSESHSSAILTHIAVAGTLIAVGLTHIATKKAVQKMDEVRDDLDYEPPNTKAGEIVEEISFTWKYYIPAAVVVVITIVSEVQSHKISVAKIAALSDAYRLSENLRHEYQEKVKETIGERKEGKIQEAIVQDRVNNDEWPMQAEPPHAVGNGNCLCKDWFTGRYFYCDPETIRQIKNELDAKLIAEDYICLNELYYKLHIEMIDAGRDYGWSMDWCNRTDLTGITTVAVTTPDGRPCLMIMYEVRLNYDIMEPY